MINESFNNQEYLVLQNEYDIKYIFGHNCMFNDLFAAMLEGRSEEYIQHKYRDDKDELKTFLEKHNLSEKEALAIYLYTTDNYLFAVDELDAITVQVLKQDLFIEIMKDVPRGAANEIVEKVIEIAQTDDAIFHKYEIAKKELINPLGMERKCKSINSFIQKLSLLNEMPQIQKHLTDALNKNAIGIDIKLFRATNLKKGFNVQEFVGQELNVDQIVSASATKEHAFGKYVHFNTIIEFFVAQNTRGLYAASLSARDTEDQEVILMPKTIRIIDIKEVGKKQIIRCLIK